MPEFVRAMAASDLPEGQCSEVRVLGRSIALFNVGGTFYATSNACAHRGGPLGQGYMDGPIVMCPWHAWTFDVRNGRSTANPALGVESYAVKVEDGEVYVEVAAEGSGDHSSASR